MTCKNNIFVCMYICMYNTYISLLEYNSLQQSFRENKHINIHIPSGEITKGEL